MGVAQGNQFNNNQAGFRNNQFHNQAGLSNNQFGSSNVGASTNQFNNQAGFSNNQFNNQAGFSNNQFRNQAGFNNNQFGSSNIRPISTAFRGTTSGNFNNQNSFKSPNTLYSAPTTQR